MPDSIAPPKRALNGADTRVEGIATHVASDFSAVLYGAVCASWTLFTPH
jgi:monoamine oxidase